MTMRPAAGRRATARARHRIDYRLPDTDVGRIEGVLDLLAGAAVRWPRRPAATGGGTELPDEELFPTYEALGLLGLAQRRTRRHRTDGAWPALCRRPTQALRQTMFGQQLLTNVPLAAHIRRQPRTGAGRRAAGRTVHRPAGRNAGGGPGQAHAAKSRSNGGATAKLYEYDYHTRPAETAGYGQYEGVTWKASKSRATPGSIARSR